MLSKFLTGRPKRNIYLGRPRNRLKDNVTMDLNARNWVDSARDRDY